MGKNVAVFVDVANIFYAAKAAGVDIDYVTLLKSATAGRDLVRAYAYTGLDPDNENQRNFHDFLRRSNYKVVSKDIRKYGDGKVKANLDIELVVDMMKTARNLDIAIVVSGDGDFAPAIRAVQEQGVRVEVISFRGNTSSDLMDVADQFTDIIQLARVEKGSRSGRRVADGDDLSMTEVPDKQTEGTGTGRGRGGRGRGRSRSGEAEPVVATRGRGRGRSAAPSSVPVSASAGEAGGLLALPGERLSRATGSLTEADLAAAEVFTLDDLDGSPVADASDAAPVLDDREDEAAEGGRRRRRRGGRGRGRGRGREDGATGADDGAPEREVASDRDAARPPVEAVADHPDLEDEDDGVPVAPRAPRATAFGSVWDSQLGTPTGPTAASLAPLADDEDFDEPEIPEYLIAEQRRGAGQQRGGRGGGQAGRGPRGGRSAYQSAMERERYGRGGGGGGINRYPDVSARTSPEGQGGRAGTSRGDRSYSRGPERGPERGPDEATRDRGAAPRASSEPWSDVPPELEALLRAQVSQKPVGATTDATDAAGKDDAEEAP
ncbi:MAG: NYN domain-containing protein, partial [Chloroflexota bacterium]